MNMRNNILLELAGIKIDNVDKDNEKDDIVAFLKRNPSPSKEDIKKLDVELMAEMLASFLKKFKHSFDRDGKFDKKQLEMGVEVEKEHTDDAYIAKIIAKAHLTEIKNYYDLLKKMEQKAGN